MVNINYTFNYYINTYDTENVKSFYELLNKKCIKTSELECISSKYLIKCLKLSSRVEFQIFNRVYMDFFRSKLNNVV